MVSVGWCVVVCLCCAVVVSEAYLDRLKLWGERRVSRRQGADLDKRVRRSRSESVSTHPTKSKDYEDAEAIIAQARKDIAAYVDVAADKIKVQLPHSSHVNKLINVFRKTFMNTIDTTVMPTQEGRVFVITGDINAMWLRDSVPQVEHYLECCGQSSAAVKEMLVRLVHEHAYLALQDPYANAFNDPPQFRDTRALFRRGGYVSTGNYELDSFAYSMRLAHLLWKRTHTTDHFDDMFRAACRAMMVVWKKEQRHIETTTYRYTPDELRRNGLENSQTTYTGMTWTGFRPSDDACVYHYNIPDNMMASVALRMMAEIATEIYHDREWAAAANELKGEIDSGIKQHGIVTHSKYGRIYAYEVDGLGNNIMEDDANVPSLLSIPYLNYTEADSEVLKNTLKFVWSPDNKWFFTGGVTQGIGSSHTGHGNVWHMSLIMRGIVTDDVDEKRRLLLDCLNTDAGSELMHESFNPSRPGHFTRAWFAWANSLFGYWVAKMVEQDAIPHI